MDFNSRRAPLIVLFQLNGGFAGKLFIKKVRVVWVLFITKVTAVFSLIMLLLVNEPG
jgi:hypothetical protein